MLDFLEEIRFERLGAFAFSPQEGTRAAEMGGSFVPESLARTRLEELLEVQRAISAELMAGEVGKQRTAIVDEPTGAAGIAAGRIAGQADDVDGVTHLTAAEPLEAGQIVEAVVTDSHDFDLSARILRVLRSAPAEAGRANGRPGPPAPPSGRGARARDGVGTIADSGLWDRALRVLPGGVSSPVRSFRSVGGEPFFSDHGEGAFLYDVSGRRYIDYVLSWGPLILGHAHPEVVEAVQRAAGSGLTFGTPAPAEVELAELLVRARTLGGDGTLRQ